MDPTKKRKLDENGVAQTDSDSISTNLTVEDIRKILDPFTQDQLIEILQSAALVHPDVLTAVRSIADTDHAKRKLFIRGLGWDTTTDKLRSLFSTYGDLEDAVVVLDKATGKSKGFGFIIFKHVDGALMAIKEPSKQIDGRVTVTQFAAPELNAQTVPNGVETAQAAAELLARKIYIGNVPYEMLAERLLAHFSSYGEIEEGPLGFDKITGKCRGWALFVYKTVEGAKAALVDPIKTIDGRQLHCKFADDGKKGKPGAAAPVVQAPPGPTKNIGIGLQPVSAIPSQYVVPGGGVSPYGGFSGGPQGPAPQLAQSHHPMNPPLVGGPGLGLSSVGSQASSLGSSGGYLGGPYGGSHYGGHGSTGYSAAGGVLSGAGAGLGLGGVGVGVGGGLAGGATGLGGSAPGSSLYGLPPSSVGLGGPGYSLYGLPPSSVGMPSGGYPKSAHYSLSGPSGYQGLHHQAPETSQVPRGPPGGMYQGMPPYY